MIPDFDLNGNLPSGIHWATWSEFVKRFNFSRRREKLMKGLRRAIAVLKNAGSQVIFIDGSFVTTKEDPNDYDACWDLNGVDPSLLDPILLIFDNGRIIQKTKYFGELFPAQFSEARSGKAFLEFFGTDKETGLAKGIIAINLLELDDDKK